MTHDFSHVLQFQTICARVTRDEGENKDVSNFGLNDYQEFAWSFFKAN